MATNGPPAAPQGTGPQPALSNGPQPTLPNTSPVTRPPPGIYTDPLETPADRAQHQRVSEQIVRIDLDEVSFHPDNRGGQGAIPNHIHQVANNWMRKGTIARR